MFLFIKKFIVNDFIREIGDYALSQGKIITEQVEPSFDNLSSEYTFQYVENLVKRYSLEMNSRILLINKLGDVVLDTSDGLVGENYAKVKEIRMALDGNSDLQVYNSPNKKGKILYLGTPISNGKSTIGAVFMSMSVDRIFNKISKQLFRLMILSIACLFATAIIGFLFADVLSRPLENITYYVRDITKGIHNKRLDVNGNDEFTNLCNAFNIMVTKLDKVDEQRRAFVSNVSHELRTPMTSLKILSSSLLDKEHWEEEKYREFLTDIDDEITRLNNLIDSLLELVNLEKEELDINYETTYVNYLIKNVIRKLLPLANYKNIDLEFTESEMITMDADVYKMQQCLINIIGNAIKYTPENGKVIIEFYNTKSGEVTIIVSDNGIGIPPERLENIFDRFYRVDKARSRSTGGNGLGLSIAQQIVHLHQGTIDVESEEGVGTTFTIKIPQKIDL